MLIARCPLQRWHVAPLFESRAIAGFSVVGKKVRLRQRKLLMQVASNDGWIDMRPRAELGLRGGGH